MIKNCYLDHTKEIIYYNLTNKVYEDLIKNILKFYVSTFEEAINCSENSPNKYLEVEKFLLKLFHMYNKDKQNTEKPEELNWLL
jgi:hypothetical protein